MAKVVQRVDELTFMTNCGLKKAQLAWPQHTGIHLKSFVTNLNL